MTGSLGSVELSTDRRHVVVVPRTTDVLQISARLRKLVPGARGRLDHGVVVYSFPDAAALLDTDDVDLRWSSEAVAAVQNRAQVAQRAADVVSRARQILAEPVAAARHRIRDSRLIDRLDDHQAVNVAALTTDGTWGGCIFDEQGTGKTITMIAVFDLLVERNLADVLLVLAPKSMIREWEAQFAQFTEATYRVAVADGTRQQKAAALSSGADVVVMNYEAAVSLEADVRLLTRRCRTALAVDESFNVKNPDARRTASIAAIREWCAFAYALCGTPAPNAAVDVVAQFDLVDFGVTFGGLRLDKEPDRQVEQVREAIARRGLYVRNLKAAVLASLPGRTFNEVKVSLAPVQAAVYARTLEGLIDDVQGTDDAGFDQDRVSFLAQRSMLLRLCSDPTGVLDGYDEVPAKVQALDDLLGHLVRQRGEKVVLWSFYRSNLVRLEQRYAHLGLVRVDGSVEANERRSAIRRFQEDPSTMIFLGNPAAAGAGLTLHRSRIAIYESMSNQAAHYLQSLDRIHRRGQHRDVEYVALLAQDTIEETEYQRLLTKAKAQADLLGDPPDSRITRVLFLDELLELRKRLSGVGFHG